MMCEKTTGPTLTIGGDHKFRNPTVLAYYYQRLADVPWLEYLEDDEWPPDGPEWFLDHSQERSFNPPREIEAGEDQRHRFELIQLYPYAGLSGWHWAVYRNKNRPPVP